MVEPYSRGGNSIPILKGEKGWERGGMSPCVIDIRTLLLVEVGSFEPHGIRLPKAVFPVGVRGELRASIAVIVPPEDLWDSQRFGEGLLMALLQHRVPHPVITPHQPHMPTGGVLVLHSGIAPSMVGRSI